MQHTVDDYRYMARAIALARRAIFTTDPNPRVGCVLVRDGRPVGEGWHTRAGAPHAEIAALANASTQAQGATAYVTLEPCCHQGRTGPCVLALMQAGVARVVAAMVDPNPLVSGQGLAQLATAGIQVESGLLEAQAQTLNPGFISRMQRGRPYVRCKLAMGIDGRTAMASGESQWITGSAARRDVQRLRARSSVILTGVGTVRADDPRLTVRLSELGQAPDGQDTVRQPMRAVLDPRLETPPNAKLLKTPGRTILLTSRNQVAPGHALRRAGAEIVTLPGTAGALDLNAVMQFLAAEQANEVLLESGATLSGAMLRAGLIDELVIFVAPVLMGSDARALFLLPGIQHMHERLSLTISDVRAVGQDWRITARLRDQQC
jgi:diaminohydroxyphosphoribosylaminopyrimidine deaminase/5-amino-6-(5-phosphoribosylamino)uracil reductase